MTPQELQSIITNMLGSKLKCRVRVRRMKNGKLTKDETGLEVVCVDFWDPSEPKIRSENKFPLKDLQQGLTLQGIKKFVYDIALQFHKYQTRKAKLNVDPARRNRIILLDGSQN